MSLNDPRRYRLGLLHGDGIGPEIAPATARIVDSGLAAVGAGAVDWVELPVGWAAIDRGLPALPDDTIAELAECHGWVLGPVDFVAYPAEERMKRNPSGSLRKTFDLFANVRPAKSVTALPPGADPIDLVVVRENTEGFYADRSLYDGNGDLSVTEDVRLILGVFTRTAINRVAHVACGLAARRKRRVSIVHKANVLPRAMGLWVEECQAVAAGYDVEVEDLHADAAAALLIRRPTDFDVLVMENFLGDIFSDLAGELTGSIGLSPSLNAGADQAMAQAAHGSAPDIAGTNTANPVGLILSATMLLEWLSTRHDDRALSVAAKRIEAATESVLADGGGTPDLGGVSSTTDFVQEVVSRIGPEPVAATAQAKEHVK